jgi:hypothetical protein
VSSGRRITIALVGLVLLAVIGYLATGLGHNGNDKGSGTGPTTVATAPAP